MHFRFWQSAEVQKEHKPDPEKNIHLFWSGSKLRPQHIERIKSWKKLNKDYKVTVWVDSEYVYEIRQQLNDDAIQVSGKEGIYLTHSQASLVAKFTDEREDKLTPNYAASSDFYRFMILDIFGGWYVDTDITPTDLSKIAINKNLNFYVNAERDKDRVGPLSPSVIAAFSGNLLTKLGLEFFDYLAKEIKDKDIKAIRSSTASERMLSTEFVTGFALRGALGKISIDGKVLLNVANPKDCIIPNIALFDTIASWFDSVPEQTWILQDLITKNGRSDLTPLDNITLDPDFISLITGKENEEILRKPLSSLLLRNSVYSKLLDRSVSLLPEAEYKKGFAA